MLLKVTFQMAGFPLKRQKGLVNHDLDYCATLAKWSDHVPLTHHVFILDTAILLIRTNNMTYNSTYDGCFQTAFVILVKGRLEPDGYHWQTVARYMNRIG